MSATTYTPEVLTKLYARLHKHYAQEEEDAVYVSELVDPEAFFQGLATFALWILTEPTSERTRTQAAEYDEILTATHNQTIQSLTDGQRTAGCRCMEQYIREKIERLQTQEHGRERADRLDKWVRRLQLLE